MAALAADAPAGYATLARFREAKYRADAGDRPAAIALYDSLASDTAVEPMLRDLATLYSVRMQIAGGDPAALTARLAPLTEEGNPWRYSAGELTAVLALSVANARQNTVVVGSVSKSYAMTGWRLGYIIFPAEFSSVMNRMHQSFMISANSFVQIEV